MLSFYLYTHVIYHHEPVIDINECLNTGYCRGEFAQCINTPGSYSCKCPAPNRGDGYEFCSRMLPLYYESGLASVEEMYSSM